MALNCATEQNNLYALKTACFWYVVVYCLCFDFNYFDLFRYITFTPKSDQVQISPVASPVILHHTVWRTWLFIAYSDWKMILVPVLTTSLIHFSWKGWENVLFELGIERVKLCYIVASSRAALCDQLVWFLVCVSTSFNLPCCFRASNFLPGFLTKFCIHFPIQPFICSLSVLVFRFSSSFAVQLIWNNVEI